MKTIQKLYRLNELIGDRKKGITGLLPISRSALYNGIAAGIYPKPIKLSERSVAWKEADIIDLMERLSSGNVNVEG